MREIIFSTESTSDIPEEFIQEYGFRVLACHIYMNNGDFADSYVFPIAQIYTHCARARMLPKFSAPKEKDFTDYFQEIREDSPDSVIFHFSCSASLSSAYQVAQDVSKNFEDIYVINTRTVSAGCLVYMLLAYDLVQKKQDEITDYAELTKEIRLLAPQVTCAFIPGDMGYLMASEVVQNKDDLGGGRFMIKTDDVGHLVAGTNIRGSRKKVAPVFFKEFLSEYDLCHDTLYFIYTAGVSNSVMENIEQLAKQAGFKNLVAIQVYGISTCIAGPAAIGLAGIIKDEQAAIEDGQAAIEDEQAFGEDGQAAIEENSPE